MKTEYICEDCGYEIKFTEYEKLETIFCPKCGGHIEETEGSKPIVVSTESDQSKLSFITCEACQHEFSKLDLKCPKCGVPNPYFVQTKSSLVKVVSEDKHVMEYKVVPFVASITQNDNAAKAAAQLQNLATEYAKEGWEYVRLESVETHIAGGNGCFGIGATPDRTAAVSMVVFSR